LGLSCDSGLGHAALGLRLSLRLAPTNAHPPRRRHRCLRSRGHRVVGLRLLLRGGVLRRRRARGYRAVLVPLLHRRRLAVLLLLLGLRVLLLVLRRRLRVLRLRLLVLLLRRRLLLVLPVLLLRRRLLVLLMLLVLLLRRRLLRRRGGRPSRFVHVLPLLGVVVLLFFRKGFYTWQGKMRESQYSVLVCSRGCFRHGSGGGLCTTARESARLSAACGPDPTPETPFEDRHRPTESSPRFFSFGIATEKEINAPTPWGVASSRSLRTAVGGGTG
jgi:hypothetical protein